MSQNGASREGLSLKNLKAFPILIPPISEQEQIIRFVAQETASVRQAILTASREIELIREHHTRLIHDVVTGKVDVRHLAPAVSEAMPDDLSSLDTDADPFEDDLQDADDLEPAEEIAADD
jgi:type I restriction enzyme, S subunit